MYRWLPGTLADDDPDARLRHRVSEGTSRAFVVASARAGRPAAAPSTGTARGGRLTALDDYVHRCLGRDTTPFVAARLGALWSRLRSTPRDEPDVMTHGDLMPGNLLLDRRPPRLRCIDVGHARTGRPGTRPASWPGTCSTGAAREAFRTGLDADDHEWDRGKAWAFLQALGCLDYYRVTNPVMSQTAVRTLAALLDDEQAR